MSISLVVCSYSSSLQPLAQFNKLGTTVHLTGISHIMPFLFIGDTYRNKRSVDVKTSDVCFNVLL